MRIKDSLDERLKRTLTATPKVPGQYLTDLDVIQIFQVFGVTLLSDPVSGNQWIYFPTNDTRTGLERLALVKANKWSWRNVGDDKTDTGEGERLREALIEHCRPVGERNSPQPLNVDGQATTCLTQTDANKHRPLPRHLRGRTESSLTLATRTPIEESLGAASAREKLPPEIYIMIFSLALAHVAHAARGYNRRVEKLRQVCTRWRDVIDEAKGIWLKITSTCPNKAITTTIQKSRQTKKEGLPFSIEFIPRSLDPEAAQEMLREFTEFMKLVNSYKSQWKGLDITLPLGGWKALRRQITTPAHHLKTLNLSIKGGNELEQGSDSNVGRELELLGAVSHLENVLLENIPVHYDPSPFVNLSQLQLSGVHISADEIIFFLGNAVRLQILSLTDVSSTEDFQSTLQDPILLPTLRSLTLHELSSPINMFDLFLSLHAPNCRYLRLALARHREETPEELNSALQRFGRRISTTIQATADSDSNLASYIRLGDEDEECEWWSEGTDPDGQPVEFRVALRLENQHIIDPMAADFTTLFCRFVKRVLDQAGRTPEIMVDLLNHLKGTRPRLQPQVLEGLNISQLSLNTVDGYLARVTNFVTIAGSTSRRFPRLESIHLINTQSVEEERRCGSEPESLAEFIQHLSRSGYTTSNEDRAVTIVLHGRFVVSDGLWSAAVQHGKFKGISVDYSLGRIWAEDGRILFLKEGSVVGGWEDPLKIERP